VSYLIFVESFYHLISRVSLDEGQFVKHSKSFESIRKGRVEEIEEILESSYVLSLHCFPLSHLL